MNPKQQDDQVQQYDDLDNPISEEYQQVHFLAEHQQPEADIIQSLIY